LAMLGQITNGDPTFKGEMGIQQIMKFDRGMANATGLNSTSDILAYRAAKNLTKGKPYYMAQELMEEGLSGENGTKLYNEYMKMLNRTFGKDKAAKIESFKDMGFSQRQSRKLVEGYTPGAEITREMLDILLNEKEKELPEVRNNDLLYDIVSMNVRNLIIKEGMRIYDEDMPFALQDARRGIQETTGRIVSGAGNLDVPEPSGIPFNIREKIPEIDSKVTTVLPNFFGHGGDARSDRTAKRKIESMVDSAMKSNDDSQIYAAFNAMNILNNIRSTVGNRWDREDKLNPLAESGTITELLA